MRAKSTASRLESDDERYPRRFARRGAPYSPEGEKLPRCYVRTEMFTVIRFKVIKLRGIARRRKNNLAKTNFSEAKNRSFGNFTFRVRHLRYYPSRLNRQVLS